MGLKLVPEAHFVAYILNNDQLSGPMIRTIILRNICVYRLLRKVPLLCEFWHLGRKLAPITLLNVLLVTLCTWQAASAAELSVEIVDIAIEKGALRIAACSTREAFESRQCTTTRLVEPKIPCVFVTFSNLAKSSYAILVHQDLNENGLLDKSIMGIPQEPIGFSNNPTIMFGPPDFDDVLVAFTENKKISIKLHNE